MLQGLGKEACGGQAVVSLSLCSGDSLLAASPRAVLGSLQMHSLLLPPGLSPPTYATFQATPTLIPAETAALYPSSALLPAARVPAAPTPVAYYPGPATQLYMNYTAYYPRYQLLRKFHSLAPILVCGRVMIPFLGHVIQGLSELGLNQRWTRK